MDGHMQKILTNCTESSKTCSLEVHIKTELAPVSPRSRTRSPGEPLLPRGRRREGTAAPADGAGPGQGQGPRQRPRPAEPRATRGLHGAAVGSVAPRVWPGLRRPARAPRSQEEACARGGWKSSSVLRATWLSGLDNQVVITDVLLFCSRASSCGFVSPETAAPSTVVAGNVGERFHTAV